MPIHLPSLTRRAFLTRSAAAAAGLFAGRRIGAADKPADPQVWALLADTHIAADTATRSRGVSLAENLGRVIGDLLALPRAPAAALVNGDLAHNTGEAADYRTLSGLLDPARGAGLSFHLTLGNHDHRGNARRNLAEIHDLVSPVPDRRVATVRGERANWFLLDSLGETNKVPGLLGPDQIAWLEHALDEEPFKPALVFGHHNLNLQGGETKQALKDSEALLGVLVPRRQVKAYVFGHTHIWDVQKHSSGIHLVNLPPTAYAFDAKRPSGWVEAELHAAGMKLRLHALDPQHPEHGKTRELAWRS